MKKQFREYAKTHNLTILAFLKEQNSEIIFGVAIEKRERYDGQPLYSFGKLYKVHADKFVFDPQGIYSSSDFKEVKQRAYDFFGIK